MKQILLTLVATCALLASCKDTKKGQKLDPYASITLSGTTATSTASGVKAPPAPPYSIQTVAKYAFEMVYKSTDPTTAGYMRGFSDRNIDAGKLKVGQMDDVVMTDGEGLYKLGWIITSGFHDVVCVARFQESDPSEWAEPILQSNFSGVFDTIGYVPNAVVQRAEAAIRTAFDAGDYEECMRLFESAYVFIPTTGSQWRALKAEGIE